jgi:hypothetical protein
VPLNKRAAKEVSTMVLQSRGDEAGIKSI